MVISWQRRAIWRALSRFGFWQKYRFVDFIWNKKERTSKPIPFSLSQFTYGVDSQRITCRKYITPSYLLIDEENITNEDRKRRGTNYNIIKELVEDRMFIFNYAFHKNLIYRQSILGKNKSHSVLSGHFWLFTGSMGRIYMLYCPHTRTAVEQARAESGMRLNSGTKRKTECYLIYAQMSISLMKGI